jgi:tetratricopeptide (TPR) repeat protein
MNNSIPVFNPRSSSQDTLEAMLVGRDGLIREILDDLRAQTTSETRQHWLLQGPRGMGKTHLAAILYYRVRGDAELSRAYLPVWLPETDAYQTVSAARLLGAIADQCAEELDAGGGPGNGQALLDERSRVEKEEGDPFDGLHEMLVRFATREGRTLLVLVENLDAMLSGFAPKERKFETRRFRALLLHSREFLFISTTPTHRLRGLSDPREPLYGHLRERTLRPLTEEEVGTLQETLRGFGLGQRQPMQSDDPNRLLRARVLHRLTGGIPRSVVMTCEAASGKSGVMGVVKDLLRFLDRQTAYFEARLRDLAPHERTIAMAMALEPENLALQDIARAARLPVRSLSTLVDRLGEAGMVAPVDGSGGKGALYKISDPLFRVWYQYRKGRQVIEPLVRFIALWLDERALASVQSDLDEECGDPAVAPPVRDLARYASATVKAALEFGRSNTGQKEWIGLRRPSGEPEAGIVEKEEQDPSRPKSTRGHPTLPAGEEERLEQLSKEADSAYESGHRERALAVLDEVLQLCEHKGGKPADRHTCRALFNKGVTLGALGRSEEAIGVYDIVVRRFGKRKELPLAGQVARALFNKGVRLGALGRSEEAIGVYDIVVRRFGKRKELSLAEQVARALFNKGVRLGALGRSEEAIAVYDEVVRRFGAREELPLAEWVAKALVNKGASLAAIGRTKDAAEVLAQVVKRYGLRQDPSLAESCMRACVLRGLAEAVTAPLRGKRSVDEGLRQVGGLGDDAHFWFLARLPELQVAYGPEDGLRWLDLLALSTSDEKVRGQVVYHRVVALLVGLREEAMSPGKAGAEARKAFSLGLSQVPPELRQTIEEAVEYVTTRRSPQGRNRRRAGKKRQDSR